MGFIGSGRVAAALAKGFIASSKLLAIVTIATRSSI